MECVPVCARVCVCVFGFTSLAACLKDERASGGGQRGLCVYLCVMCLSWVTCEGDGCHRCPCRLRACLRLLALTPA